MDHALKPECGTWILTNRVNTEDHNGDIRRDQSQTISCVNGHQSRAQYVTAYTLALLVVS